MRSWSASQERRTQVAKGKARRAFAEAQAQAMTQPRKRHASKYARKRSYLNRFGGWGWEYAVPKPWK